ncbi:DnaD domain protein [Lactobacillus sp. ZJLC29-4]|nr:DnaD domain protein [Lactobacillus sp. HBUAS51387]
MDRILLNWEKRNLKTAVQAQRDKAWQNSRPNSSNTTPGNDIPDVPIFKLTDN